MSNVKHGIGPREVGQQLSFPPVSLDGDEPVKHGLQPTPDSCNTGVLSSQASVESVSGGVDFLEVSAWVSWGRPVWDKLEEKLERLLETAQNAEEKHQNRKSILETEDGDELEVMPFGIGRGIRCRYQLVWRGVRIGIVAGGDSRDNRPGVRVWIPSDILMVRGHVATWEAVEGILRALGGEVYRTKVTRLDACVDLAGVGCEEFVERFNSGAVIARAKTATVRKFGRAYSGVELGKAIKCRIYDKRLEADRNGDKLGILIQRRWGGVLPEKATRVEFQIRGKELRDQFGEEMTVQAIFGKLHRIVDWLVTEWLRFTDAPVDHENKNHSRAKVAEIWERTVTAFRAWAKEFDGCHIRPVRRIKTASDALIKQALGCLAKAFAMDEPAGESLLEDVERLPLYVQRVFVRACGLDELIEHKRQALAFQSALGPPIPDEEIPF